MSAPLRLTSPGCLSRQPGSDLLDVAAERRVVEAAPRGLPETGKTNTHEGQMQRPAPTSFVGPKRHNPIIVPLTVLSLLLFASATAQAASVFEKDHPQVAEATKAYERGDFEEALRLYEAAGAAFDKRPAELQFNMGNTLLRLGKHEEARQAYERALATANQEGFKADSFYNLGNAFLSLDQQDSAKVAYRQALKINPKHEPARRNLELLLRGKPPESNENQQSQDPSDGGEEPPDAGEDKNEEGGDPDAGQEQSEDGGESDAAQQEDGGQSEADGGSDEQDGGGESESADGGEQEDGGQQQDSDEREDGGESDDRDASSGDDASMDASESRDGGDSSDASASDASQDGGEGESNDRDAGEEMDGGESEDLDASQDDRDAGERDAGPPPQSAQPQETSTQPEQIERQQAEELLDALRRNEKQFLMYQQKGQVKSRVDPEKDW
ncbi:MAG: tetratricopeptide repeat protein [Myxococcales bacterium]|nr:tetratricopeptide repeat protein [Myxococcales bacterium]